MRTSAEMASITDVISVSTHRTRCSLLLRPRFLLAFYLVHLCLRFRISHGFKAGLSPFKTHKPVGFLHRIFLPQRARNIASTS